MRFTIYQDEDGRPCGTWEDGHPQHEMLLEDGDGIKPMHSFYAESAEFAFAYAQGYAARYFDERREPER